MTTQHPADKYAQFILRRYPRARDMEKVFLRDRAEFGEDWPPWCGLPMAATHAIITQGAPMQRTGQGVEDLPALTAALLFMRGKVVYRFDDALAQALIDQGMTREDEALPRDILYRMPYDCIYIDARLDCEAGVMDGFFAWMESDAHTHIPELRLLFLRHGGGALSVPVVLAHDTLAECMDVLRREFLARGDASPEFLALVKEATGKDVAGFYGVPIAGCINLLIYIISQGADISGVQRHRTYDRKTGWPREVQPWDVGMRIGAAIRAYKARGEDDGEGARAGDGHASPRPHMRRAHWHRFWRGPKDGQREIIVRWLPPIPVGYDADAEQPVVLHEVETTPDTDRQKG